MTEYLAEYLAMSATTSGDGLYRYELYRQWTKTDDPSVLTFVMLNPSTADGMTDDPTIRRCVRVAQRFGHDALRVVNLFAFRATNPRALIEILEHGADEENGLPSDPVGPMNDDVVSAAVDRPAGQSFARDVVLAWGAWGAHEAIAPRVAYVTQMLDHERVYHLGERTEGGQPRHPLYLPSDVPMHGWW